MVIGLASGESMMFAHETDRNAADQFVKVLDRARELSDSTAAAREKEARCY
jgi:hypothetical protein